MVKMSAVIRKKCWPQAFAEIKAGRKKADVRLADFSCKPGDVLFLEEWDPETKKYTGDSLRLTITHVLKTNEMPYFTQDQVEQHGFLVLSLGD